MKKHAALDPMSEALRSISGLQVKTGEPLARHTSIRVGGAADYFIEVLHESALGQVLVVLKHHRVPFCLLGRGSNVLVSDRGIRGAVLCLGGRFNDIQWRESRDQARITIGAAFPVARLVRRAVGKGFDGLEFAEGIPGSVGGALVMNAGAYGSEMEKVVSRVEGMTPEGLPVAFNRNELEFSYRRACLPPGTIVTRVELVLNRGEGRQAAHKVRELTRRRKNSQPSGYPNAGSMFRNPPGEFAGRLIEQAGLKGTRIGKAKISERHANFIVNLGGASAEDVRRLMDLARVEVKNKCGIQLEPEVQFLGEWMDGEAGEQVESRTG